MRLKFQKGDLLAVAVVLLMTFFTMLGFRLTVRGQPAEMLFVFQNGELILELPLSEAQEYTVEGEYTNKVEIRDGQARIIWSDCPGGDCVHSPGIREGGQSIICLPNRVELRIGGESEVDFVVK